MVMAMQDLEIEKQQSGAVGKDVPVGYKLTDVGVIPENWNIESFSSIAMLRNEKFNPRINGIGDYCIELEHIGQGTGETDGSSETSLSSSIKNIFYKDDILFGKLRAYLKKYWLAAQNGVCSTEIWVLKAIPEKSVSGFIFQSVQTENFINIASEAYGTHMPRADWNIVKEYQLAVPPIKEQVSIVEVLSDTDALITSLKKSIAKKQAIKNAAMQQLLTGNTRLPQFALREDGTVKGYKRSELGEVPEDWSIFSIGDIADVKTGPFGSSLHEKDYVLDGTPIITVEHLGELGITYQNLPMVSDKDKNRLRPYQLNEGDIVFSRVGSVDRNGLICKDQSGWLFSGRLLRVRLKNALHNPAYLSFQFHSTPFKKRVIEVAVGQTMPSLNTTILKGIAVIMPEYEEQTAIAAILSDMDKEIQVLQQRLEKTRQLKQGMMQELLTGKIRLI